MVKGMGGAMDLVSASDDESRVIVLTTHCSKTGEPKILEQCSLPLTGYRVVNMIITEKCVFKIDKEKGLVLTEIADGVTVDEVKRTTGCTFIVSPNLKPMGQVAKSSP